MTNILAFLQRLVSPIGKAEVQAAWLEFATLVGCVTAIVADLKVKNFSDLLSQGNMVYAALLILIGDVRSIIMSNQTAIGNDALPKVTGTLATPGVAPTATNSIPKP